MTEAWGAAFEEHYVDLVRFCFLLTSNRDVAADLAQEAFVRAARRLATLSSNHARRYLRRVAVNAWKNRLRRYSIERRHQPIEGPGAVDPIATVDTRDAVIRALDRLSTKQRACIVLRFLDDMSEAEVADTLGMSVGTVKTHCFRGLRHLKKELGDDFRS